MNKKYLLIFFCFINLGVNAQDKNEKVKKDKWFGFFIGINNSEFVRNEKLNWNSTFKTLSPGINTGLHFRPYNLGIISSMIQVSYSQKGATETFNLSSIEEKVSVRTNLNYAQIEIVPLEFVPFYRQKMSPFISGGLYFSKLLKSKIRYQYGDSFNVEDDINDFLLGFEPDQKNEQGIAIMAGLRFENFRLELRNEFGRKAIYTNTPIKNHSNTILLRYSL
jgi:hypothetical protein